MPMFSSNNQAHKPARQLLTYCLSWFHRGCDPENPLCLFFCCWEPPALKLISGDSNEIGRVRGSYDAPSHSKLIVHKLTHQHYPMQLLSDICLQHRWLEHVGRSLLLSDCSLSRDSAYVLILEDFIKFTNLCGGVETEQLKGISDFSCKLSQRPPTH